MPDDDPDIAEERAILGRLAQAHKEWRDKRPLPPAERDAFEKWFEEELPKLYNPEPQDVEALHAARTDPLLAAIRSQLSVVGWRLYAKGGEHLMTAVYRGVKQDQHCDFVSDTNRAWWSIGFPGDPRGVWTGVGLL
jgi:hypothetical protein